jgi:catechol 2,3-dioxygenase-like lactoylglutathione lyase family enzyme
VSLEYFKKQATLLVRWHRERNYSVGGRIRQLSRYEDLTDTEALALPFLLNEAQEIIALEQGYNSWAELKQRLKKALKTTRRAPAALKLTKAMPVLYVSDVQAAADFYRDKLGFTIDFLHGHPAFYGSVSRDEARIHLRFVHQPMYVAGLREKERVDCCFSVGRQRQGTVRGISNSQSPLCSPPEERAVGPILIHRLGPGRERSLLRRMSYSRKVAALGVRADRDASALIATTPLIAGNRSRLQNHLPEARFHGLNFRVATIHPGK